MVLRLFPLQWFLLPLTHTCNPEEVLNIVVIMASDQKALCVSVLCASRSELQVSPPNCLTEVTPPQ